VLFEHFLELRLADGSDLLFHNLAAFEEKNRGDPADSVTASRLLVRIHVQLANLNLAGVIGRYLIDSGAHHAARTAPFGPKVHEYRYVRVEDIFIEAVVCKGQCVVSCHVNLLFFDDKPALSIHAAMPSGWGQEGGTRACHLAGPGEGWAKLKSHNFIQRGFPLFAAPPLPPLPYVFSRVSREHR
jgi:hypothetical protein